jgi:hypothetical protein
VEKFLKCRARNRVRLFAQDCLSGLLGVVVLAGKFAFDSKAATYGGLAVLIAASIWNA